MRPILKNILFKPFPAEEKSESGIVVPEAFRKPNNKGTIVAIGNRVTKLKEGQVGIRVKDWGTEITIEGEQHFIMDENAILATV